ncbi:hypothetical protein GCM10012275_16660 [Longimycelium tulufanense]|uniref:OmpR/PhoB-type domain-containing protein n=1 Tax=Longimycelium tulufanense TaxID=907463 RepID=A0A8J3CAW1_9PSEU|nr:helix-turn-helix domain-containing protein [Longimycelium tulufanense]GGM46283.1 hypothetical protein GCM10012275_16660 [Longimycelium tulufanense]
MKVPVLRWPEDAEEVARCRALGLPRLLLLERSACPPVCADPLEDWARTPVPEDDLRARTAALLARAAGHLPVVDTANVLHFCGSALLLGPGEAPLVRLLVHGYRSLVTRAELAMQIWPDAAPHRRNALDLRVLRIRRRIAPLGLEIRTVWGRGYVLTSRCVDPVTPGDPDHVGA